MSQYFESGYIDANYLEGDATEASATLQSQFTITCEPVDPYIESGYINQDYFEGDGPAGTTQEASAALNSSFAQSTQADRLVSATGINLVMSNNVLSITVTRLFPLVVSITQAVLLALPQPTKITDTDSSVSAQVTLNAQVDKVIQMGANINGVFNATMSIVAFKNHTAVLDVNVSFTATASRFTGAEETLSNIVTLSLQGARSRSFESNPSSQFTQTAQITKLIDADSTQNSQFSISVSVLVLKIGSATINTAFSQSIQASRTRTADSSQSIQISLSCSATETSDFVVTPNSQFELSVSVSRTRSATANFAAVVSQVSVAVELSDYAAVMSAQFGLSADVSRTRSSSISLSGAITLSCSAVETDSFAADLTAQFSQSITASRTRTGSGAFSSVFELNPPAQINAIFEPNFTTSNVPESDSLDAVFSQSTQAERLRDTTASVSGSVSVSAQGDTVKETSAQINSNSSLNASVNVVAENTITLSGAFTPVFDVNAYVNFFVEMNSVFAGRNGGEFLAKQTVLTRSTTVETIVGSNYSNTFTIDTNDKKYGTASLKQNYVAPPGDTTLRNSTNSSYVIWDGSKYWKFGQGYSHSSSDGETWSVASNDLGVSPGYVYYGNNTYVILSGSTIYYSSNGTSWSSRTLSPYTSTNLQGIIYTNNKWLVWMIGNSTRFAIRWIDTLTSSTSTGLANINYDGTGGIQSYGYVGEYDSAHYFFSSGRLASSSYENQIYKITFNGSVFQVQDNGRNFVYFNNQSVRYYIRRMMMDTSGNFYMTLSQLNVGSSLDYVGNDEYTFFANGGSAVEYLPTTNQPTKLFNRTQLLNGNFITFDLGGYYVSSSWSDLGSNTPKVLPLASINDWRYENSKYFTHNSHKFVIGNDIAVDKSFGNSYFNNADQSAVIDIYDTPGTALKLHTWKTFDVWFKGDIDTNLNNGSHQFNLANLWNLGDSDQLIQIQRTSSIFRIYSGTSTTGDVFTEDTWHHFRIVRDQGKWSWYADGVRVVDNENVSYEDAEAAIIQITTPNFTESILLDDYRLTSDLKNSLSDSSITVPTAPFVNDDSTLLLMSFDSAIKDDAEFIIVEQADLTAVSSVVANISYAIADHQATLNVVAGVSVDADKIKLFESSQSAVSSISSTALRIQPLSSTLSSVVTLSADISILKIASSDQSVVATQSATVGVIKQGDASFEAINTQLTAASKIGDFLMAFDNIISVSITAVKTTDITKELSAIASQNVSAERSRDVDSDFDVAFSQQTDVSKFTGYDADLDCVVQLQNTITKFTGYTADLLAEFTGVFESLPIREVPAALSSEITVDIIAVKQVEADSNQSVSVAMTVEATAGLFGEATIDSEIDLTITGTRIQQGEADFDSVGAVLAAVAKIGVFVIAADTIVTIDIEAVKTTSTQSDMQAAIALSIEYTRIRPYDADISSQFTQTAEGTTNGVLAADVLAEFTAQTDPVKTASFEVAMGGVGGFVMSAGVNRTTDIDLINTCNVSVDVDRFRDTQIPFNVVVSFECNAGKLVSVGSAISSAVTQTATARIIHLDEYVYVIPNETTEYKIVSDSREYKIVKETRLHKVVVE
jgi:hypothetical protein